MKFRYLLGFTTFLGLPVIASASDFGCQALLCFAGGKGVSECQPTIKKVLKDLAKGKSFPSCTFVGSNGNEQVNSGVSVNRFTERSNSRVCRDGQTQAIRTPVGNYCKTIEIKINPQFAASKDQQTQYFNY